MNTPSTTLWLDNATLSKNVLQNGSFEDGSFAGWTRSSTTVNQAVYNSGAHGGTYFAATNSSTTTDSIRSDVRIRPQLGDVYTAEVWVKSSVSTPIVGTLAVWGLGGSQGVATKDFTATSTWSLVTLNFTVSADDYSSLRYELYWKTPSSTLFFDDAQLY